MLLDRAAARMLPLAQPDLGERERAYARAALDAGWISGTGPDVTRLEGLLASRFDRHALACANGTVALDLALRALEIGPGDEVIVPALTFAAPAAAVVARGATVVFADISADSWTLDPADVLRQTTPRTKAVIAVDVLGHPCDYARLKPLNTLGIYLIEDAAEAHGAAIGDQPCGSFGAVAVFSFHANKTITMGEGGAVLTRHRNLAERLRLAAHHGMTPQRPYWHEVVGTNGRLNNLSAAIGCAQVERWDELTAKRRQVARWYDSLLPDGVRRRPVAPWATEGPWLYTVTHPERDRLVRALRAAGIDARAIWPALPDNPVYAGARGNAAVARRIAATAFWLPTYHALTPDDVAYVCRTLEAAL